MSWQIALKKQVKARIKFNEPLNQHTTFKVGGPVDVWIEPEDLVDLSQIIRFSSQKKVPFIIVGGGSNLLIKDKGFRGIAVNLSQPFFKKLKFSDNAIAVGSGLNLSRVVSITASNGLSGCEFLVGIPGSVGGALVMNAGIKDNSSKKGNYYKSIGDLVDEVTAMNYDGSITTLGKKALRFSYRSSNIFNYIVLSAKFKLSKKDEKEINLTMRKFLDYKKSVQDLHNFSAGCIFKNLKSSSGRNLSTGQLIDQCGLKGLAVGDAFVSKKHANFIINKGKAKACDILSLINIIQREVKQRFGFILEPEIKIVGEG